MEKTYDIPTPSKKSHLMISRRVFLLKSGVLYPSLEEEVDYVHLKDFLEDECVLYLKQSLTSPQGKIIVACCTSNHKLAIQSGR